MLFIDHSNLLTDGKQLREINREIVSRGFKRVDIRKNMAEASETSAAYLRVLKMYEARDEYRRKFHEEKELKKLEAKFSNLNNADDGVIVDDSKQIKKGFTEEQMRLPKFELACKDELGPPEVSAHGIPMDYLTPGPWFTEAPKAAFCTTW